MSIANLHTLTPAQFNALSYAILSKLEGNKALPYTDNATAHYPTIGIGFNLDVESVRNEVFDSIVIEATSMDIHRKERAGAGTADSLWAGGARAVRCLS
jgi:hypothetical protein